MNSGIYRFTFDDGSFYIGKSIDITKRWKQHIDSMEKGTHTVKIQACYNDNGMPDFEVMQFCHPHHLDILEDYFINIYWANNILNTTRPTSLSKEDIHFITHTDEDWWNLSTFEHINRISKLDTEIYKLEGKLSSLTEGTELANLAQKVDTLTKNYEDIKSRGFLSRLFNLDS